MLKPAIMYKDQLRIKMSEIFLDRAYRYYFVGGREYIELNINEDTWNSYSFVSVDSNDEIVGMIAAEIDRVAYGVTEISAINFANSKKLLYAKDMNSVFKFLLSKNFNRIGWTVIVGNPAEKQYDRYCKNNGCRIVGIKRNAVCIDNQLFDIKMYEINPKDFRRTVDTVYMT